VKNHESQGWANIFLEGHIESFVGT